MTHPAGLSPRLRSASRSSATLIFPAEASCCCTAKSAGGPGGAEGSCGREWGNCSACASVRKGGALAGDTAPAAYCSASATAETLASVAVE